MTTSSVRHSYKGPYNNIHENNHCNVTCGTKLKAQGVHHWLERQQAKVDELAP